MKFKLKITAIIALGFLSTTFAFSQEEKVDTLVVLGQRITQLEDAATVTKKLKVSGYIQTQWQSSQIDSLGTGFSKDMKVGNGVKSPSETTDLNRFGIRRGRIKLSYDDAGYQGVLQFDLTEKGVALKDAYLIALDPWIGYLSLKAGVGDRPFGYEISYSSSRRESPERSRVFQTLFPDERDLGVSLILQAPKTSPWNVLKLEAGLFAGNGISIDNDSKKDFIGHLSYNKALSSNVKIGFGASIYDGSIFQPTKKVYSISDGVFAIDSASTNLNSFAKRQYIGLDGQLSVSSVLGLSSIRAEYLSGTQPGSASSTNSPNATTVVTADTYLRKFNGGYVHFIQDIADTKHSIVVKYDWYDPNTDVAGENVGKGITATQKTNKSLATGKADMAYSTLGFGYMYRMNNNVRIMAYYDLVSNEKVSVKGFFTNTNDNLATIRVQYKF